MMQALTSMFTAMTRSRRDRATHSDSQDLSAAEGTPMTPLSADDLLDVVGGGGGGNDGPHNTWGLPGNGNP